MIVIGDKKGPDSYPLEGVEFLSLNEQLEMTFELPRKLPTGHYSRKNVGYLAAMEEEAKCIYETDDDNAPMEGWKIRTKSVNASKVPEKGWVNAYRFFTDQNIWPRGFPLDEIAKGEKWLSGDNPCEIDAPIQQGLADNSPDVDAIWRLVLGKSFQFKKAKSVYLHRGAWCPFNSQSTWWWPEAYPLLYLPSYCSFRMTDIWRSFIAQRCLWEMGYGVVFHSPEVLQERNDHNLMRDFSDEIPGYMRNKEFVSVLEGLDLKSGSRYSCDNLMSCYKILVMDGFFEERELDLVEAWISDIERILNVGEVGVKP
jgi:hypothetical protein